MQWPQTPTASSTTSAVSTAKQPTRATALSPRSTAEPMRLGILSKHNTILYACNHGTLRTGWPSCAGEIPPHAASPPWSGTASIAWSHRLGCTVTQHANTTPYCTTYNAFPQAETGLVKVTMTAITVCPPSTADTQQRRTSCHKTGILGLRQDTKGRLRTGPAPDCSRPQPVNFFCEKCSHPSDCSAHLYERRETGTQRMMHYDP